MLAPLSNFGRLPFFKRFFGNTRKFGGSIQANRGLYSTASLKHLPLLQTSGCILDQLEKVCEGEGAQMIAPNAGENVWMCCHLVEGEHQVYWMSLGP